MSDRSVTAVWIATLVVLAAAFYAFCVFAPLTYGTPGLDVDGVNARKWLPWDLHFAT
jgi:dolichyl-phosphate-mannose-protein mannosyltransferase